MLTLDFVRKTATLDDRTAYLTRHQVALLHELRLAFPGFARLDKLMMAMWPDENWPDRPGHMLSQNMYRLKRLISPLKLGLENKPGWGYRLTGLKHPEPDHNNWATFGAPAP